METPPMEPTSSQKSSRSRSERWNIIRAIVLIVLVIAGGTFFFLSKKSSEKKAAHPIVFFRGNVEVEPGTKVVHGRTIVGAVDSVRRIPSAMQLFITSTKSAFERQVITIFPNTKRTFGPF